VEPLDLFRIGLRWIHAIAALVWVGGSAFWYLVIGPALADQQRPPGDFLRTVGQSFTGLVQTAVPVLLISGMVLSFDRLSQPQATVLYYGLLGLKVVLALWMIWLNRELALRRRRPSGTGPRVSRGPAPTTLILGLGLAVYFLADALKVVFEAGMR
jgi:uncharacterized membrane protein